MPRLDHALRRTSAARSRPRPAPPSGERELLSASDFTYLGRYKGGDSEWLYGMGLTHRYVGGQFRLMGLKFDASWFPDTRLQEYTLPGSYGSTLTQGTTWNNIWASSIQPGNHMQIWWDEENTRLWAGHSIDYPSIAAGEGNWTSSLSTRTLNSNGTTGTITGYWGLQNVGQRANYGCVTRVPTWFRTAYGVGPYMTGMGGYTSLLAQGLGPPLGPFMAFIPDPHGVYATQAYDSTSYNIPSADYKIAADCRGGSVTTDWYPNYSTRTFDRGVRVTTNVTNNYDSGNNNTEWYSPAPNDPDGYGRWTWGDRYSNACWIDDDAGTRSRHGLLVPLSCASGTAYYQASDLHCGGRVYEFHVYDPDDLAAGVAGTLSKWKVRPRSLWQVSLTGMGGAKDGSSMVSDISGMTFDSTTSRLYVRGSDYNSNAGWVYVFQVG